MLIVNLFGIEIAMIAKGYQLLSFYLAVKVDSKDISAVTAWKELTRSIRPMTRPI